MATTRTTTLRQRPDYEAFEVMDSFDYRHPAPIVVPVAKVNKKASHMRNPRSDDPRFSQGIDRGHVNSIIEAILAGRAIPILVVKPLKNGTFDILGGSHRFEAIETLSIKEFQAYPMNPPDEEEDAFISALNDTHGIGNSVETRIKQAVDDVIRNKVSCKEAAHRRSVPSRVVTDRVYIIEHRQKLEEIGVKVPEDSPETHIRLLAQLSTQKNIQRAAAIVTFECKLIMAELQQMVKDIKEAHSEFDKLAVIERVKKNQEEVTKPGDPIPGDITKRKKRAKYHRICKHMEQMNAEIGNVRKLINLGAFSEEDQVRFEALLDRHMAMCRGLHR
jgi:ParB-like nuclease domain